jgi:hypothetical protein
MGGEEPAELIILPPWLSRKDGETGISSREVLANLFDDRVVNGDVSMKGTFLAPSAALGRFL